MDKLDDSAMVAGLDFMVAIVLVLAAVMMAILIMPSLSHEDRDWRNKQYMVATRASDNMVQDTGSPSNWEPGWISNYSNVSKIGLVYVDSEGNVNQKVLNLTKVKGLMKEGYIDIQTNITGNDTIGTNTTWWEFPNDNTSLEEKANATRALGLDGYNFYMQLHPVLDSFNSTPLQTNRSRVPINIDTVSVVDRYVYIVDPYIQDNIKYLKFNNEAIHYRLNLWVW